MVASRCIGERLRRLGIMSRPIALVSMTTTSPRAPGSLSGSLPHRTAGSSELALDGDRYEAWVAGLDPLIGEPRGRLRQDANAVRFVEVVVNGPKSWSLAAALHPEIAEAYDAAMDVPQPRSSAGLPRCDDAGGAAESAGAGAGGADRGGDGAALHVPGG